MTCRTSISLWGFLGGVFQLLKTRGVLALHLI
jgi:hypothetical protein